VTRDTDRREKSGTGPVLEEISVVQIADNQL